jgi:hypothetical protein
MLLILTANARHRMALRAIDVAWIGATIRHPERIAPDLGDAALTRAWRHISQPAGARAVFRQAGACRSSFDRVARRCLWDV